jgi:hypothetical protein
LSHTSFEKTLLVAIDEGLSSLGDSPKQAILFHLENSFKLTRTRIPMNLTGFVKALEEIFGPGASYLEKLILKNLYEKLDLEFEEEEMRNFMDHVDDAKKHLKTMGDV